MISDLAKTAPRVLGAVLISLAASCAKPDSAREDVWSMTADGNCRTVSAGWGAPEAMVAGLIGEAYKPVAIDRMGGAPVFLFFHQCTDASLNGESTGPFTFAALYVYAEPAAEIPAPLALERGSGQAAVFVAGDANNPVLAAFARHGVTLHDADVTLTESEAPDGTALTGVITFGGGKVTVEEIIRMDGDGDDFRGAYEVAAAQSGRLALFRGEESLARRKARRVTVTAEGTTPLSGMGLPADQYMSGMGERIVSDVTLKSEPAR